MPLKSKVWGFDFCFIIQWTNHFKIFQSFCTRSMIKMRLYKTIKFYKKVCVCLVEYKKVGQVFPC